MAGGAASRFADAVGDLRDFQNWIDFCGDALEFAGALEKLEPLAADGLVELSSAEVRATALGRIFLRNLAMPFDAHLTESPAAPVFSRTL